MKVQCQSCKTLTHNTTEAFDPDKRPDRTMVELLEPFKSWGYGDGFQDLECPNCESPLAPGGRLTVVPDNHGSDMKKERTEQVTGMFKVPIEIIEDEPDVEPLSKSEQIRDLLTNSDMTLKKIAEMVGTSPAYVSNVKGKMRNANG